MSDVGLGIAAHVFHHLQTARHRLLLLGTRYNKHTDSSKQDIMLAQMIESMKLAGVYTFTGITTMKIKSKRKAKKHEDKR